MYCWLQQQQIKSKTKTTREKEEKNGRKIMGEKVCICENRKEKKVCGTPCQALNKIQ